MAAGQEQLVQVWRELLERSRRTQRATPQRSLSIIKALRDTTNLDAFVSLDTLQPPTDPQWAIPPTWDPVLNTRWSVGAKWGVSASTQFIDVPPLALSINPVAPEVSVIAALGIYLDPLTIEILPVAPVVIPGAVSVDLPALGMTIDPVPPELTLVTTVELSPLVLVLTPVAPTMVKVPQAPQVLGSWHDTSSSPSTTHTFTPGLNPGNNVAITLSCWTSVTVNSVTFDGTPMTLVRMEPRSGNNLSFFVLPIGNQPVYREDRDVVFNLASSGHIHYTQAHYNNVDQTTPYTDATGNNGVGTTYTVSLTTGGVIVAVAAVMTATDNNNFTFQSGTIGYAQTADKTMQIGARPYTNPGTGVGWTKVASVPYAIAGCRLQGV